MKYVLTPLFTFITLSFSGFAQTQMWKQKISEPAHPHNRSEFRDFEVAPNGNIYSVGFFRGNQARFGSITAFADSARTKLFVGQTEPSCQTSFISCQAPNGNFLWVRSLSFDYGQFSMIQPTSWIGETYANQIAVGPDGSLYILGMGWGDTISYQNTIVEGVAPGTRKLGLFVLKVSSTGNFQWIKTIPYGPQQANDIGLDPAFIQTTSDQIQLVVSHDQSTLVVGTSSISNRGQTRIRMGFDGSFLGTESHIFPSNLLFQGGLPLLTRRLPDGKWILGQYGIPSQDSTSYLSILNPDFSLHTRIRVGALRSTGSPIPPVVMPVDFFRLSDTQYGLILSLLYASAIIVDGDTLDVAPNTRSVYVKLSDFTCMKTVEEWDHYPQGINSVSANGNVFTFGHSTIGSIPITSSTFRQYDRNGQLISSLPTDEEVGTSANMYGTNPAFPASFYKSRIIGNELWLMRGTSLTKLQVSDPIVGDQSFSGCLSNRSILTSVADPGIEPEAYRIAHLESGWQIEWLRAGCGELTLTNTRGQVLETLKLETGTQVISSLLLPNGMYFLHINQAGTPKIHRVLVSR